MRNILILLFWLFVQAVHANVAVDELNALIAQKEKGTRATLNEKSSDEMIKNIKENYYFVFIYKGSCPHCHKLAPVLKDFTSTFNFEVTAYSLDNQPLPEFTGTPLTPELFNTFFLTPGYKPQVPALFLVNRHTQDAFAVLFGEAKSYELATRINELMAHIEERYRD